MVSLARSGDSPESAGRCALMLKSQPEIRHLILTCNEAGKLSTAFRGDPRVSVITLPEETNDRGLVMTSSFTNLVLAARFLGLVENPERYRMQCQALSRIASDLIQEHCGDLANVAKAPFKRVCISGERNSFWGGPRSCAQDAGDDRGRVTTMSETYLGLRHGPMSYVHEDTLVVCFLSSDLILRAYETDLLRELDQKELGLLKVIVGKSVPGDSWGKTTSCSSAAALKPSRR